MAWEQARAHRARKGGQQLFCPSILIRTLSLPLTCTLITAVMATLTLHLL